MIRTKKRQGFTLIEVSLAIVIGLIMIAGATLIYNQAKTSAGNSRATEKVVALQQVVESYAAQNAGSYPNNIDTLATIWQTARPSDYNVSPWGGSVGTAAATGVIEDNGTLGDFAQTFDTNTVPTPTMEVSALQTTDIAANNALLVYDATPSNSSVVEINSPNVAVNHYCVYILDSQGRGPNFVVGGN